MKISRKVKLMALILVFNFTLFNLPFGVFNCTIFAAEYSNESFTEAYSSNNIYKIIGTGDVINFYTDSSSIINYHINDNVIVNQDNRIDPIENTSNKFKRVVKSYEEVYSSAPEADRGIKLEGNIQWKIKSDTSDTYTGGRKALELEPVEVYNVSVSNNDDEKVTVQCPSYVEKTEEGECFTAIIRFASSENYEKITVKMGDNVLKKDIDYSLNKISEDGSVILQLEIGNVKDNVQIDIKETDPVTIEAEVPEPLDVGYSRANEINVILSNNTSDPISISEISLLGGDFEFIDKRSVAGRIIINAQDSIYIPIALKGEKGAGEYTTIINALYNGKTYSSDQITQKVQQQGCLTLHIKLRPKA